MTFMPALLSSAARIPPAAPTPMMTTSAFSVAMLVAPTTVCCVPARRWPNSPWLPGPLDQRAGSLLIAIDDRVGAHKGERLNRQRRIESAHGRMGRAAEDEQVGNIPTLAVAVHHRGLRIASHAGAALVVRAG